MTVSTESTDGVREILDSAQITGSTVVIPQRLNRADYITVNTVLTAIGGTWSLSSQAAVPATAARPNSSSTGNSTGFGIGGDAGQDTQDSVLFRMISLFELSQTEPITESSTGPTHQTTSSTSSRPRRGQKRWAA